MLLRHRDLTAHSAKFLSEYMEFVTFSGTGNIMLQYNYCEMPEKCRNFLVFIFITE